jgi:hypothetical protein
LQRLQIVERVDRFAQSVFRAGEGITQDFTDRRGRRNLRCDIVGQIDLR